MCARLDPHYSIANSMPARLIYCRNRDTLALSNAILLALEEPRMSVFEIVMLICFGAAWPFSIAKAYRSRANSGKSLIFLILILIGYVSGTTHKLLYKPDRVVFLYMLNGLMVAADIAIHFRNREFAAQPDEELQGE
jgi:hypothetical protein